MNDSKGRGLVVAGGFIIMTFTMGIVYNTFAQYIVPVTADLGFTRGQYTLNQTIMFFSAMFGSVIGPSLFNRLGTVRVQRCAIAVMGAAYFCLSMARGLVPFYLIYSVCGFTMSLASTLPVSIVITQWYPEKANTAAGIAMVGTGVGGALFSPVVNSVIESAGWRTAFAASAAVLAGVSLLASFLMFNERKGAVRAAAGEKVRIRASRDLLLMCVGMAVLNLVGCMVSGVLTPHMRDLGYSSSAAAMASSGSMVAMALGKFCYGFMLDRLGLRTCLYISLFGGAVSTVGLMFFIHPVMLVLVYMNNFFLAPIGSVALPAIASWFTGDPREKISYSGVIGAVGSAAGAVNYMITGLIYDATGSYTALFMLTFVLLAIGTLAIRLLGEKKA